MCDPQLSRQFACGSSNQSPAACEWGQRIGRYFLEQCHIVQSNDEALSASQQKI
jgi:hypothetical protein